MNDDYSDNDLNGEVDVNTPNALFYVVANTYSIVKPFGAAPLDEDSNTRETTN